MNAAGRFFKKKPAAFISGYQLEKIFYYWDVGYYPSWRRWSVGTAALAKLIELLITENDDPRHLDLLYGDGEHKKRISNRSRDEEHLYLFPRNLRMFFMCRSLQLTNLVTDIAGHILDRYNLKSRLIRHFRRRP